MSVLHLCWEERRRWQLFESWLTEVCQTLWEEFQLSLWLNPRMMWQGSWTKSEGAEWTLQQWVWEDKERHSNCCQRDCSEWTLWVEHSEARESRWRRLTCLLLIRNYLKLKKKSMDYPPRVSTWLRRRSSFLERLLNLSWVVIQLTSARVLPKSHPRSL